MDYKKYSLLVLLALFFITTHAQVVNKEALDVQIEQNQLFGDSLKIPVYSSKIWGFKDSGFYFERKNNKWGLFNKNKNKLVIPHEIDSVLTVFHFPNIKSYLIKQNGAWKSIGFDKKYKIKDSDPGTGLIQDSKKKTKDPYLKDWKRFVVVYNGKRGIMNRKYETIVPLHYEYVVNLFDSSSEQHKDSIAFLTYNDDRVGIITNNVRIEPTFDDVGLEYPTYIGEFGNMRPSYKKEDLGTRKLMYDKNYFGTTVHGKKGIMNYDQKVLVPNSYDKMFYIESPLDSDPNEGTFVVAIDEKYGVINANNEILVPLEYDLVEYKETTETVTIFIVGKENKYGLISSANELVKPINFTKNELQK